MSNRPEVKEQTVERQLSRYMLFPLYIYSHTDCDGSFSAPYHWHEEIEFIYVEHGELTVHLNGVAYHLKEGDLCFINSKDLHQITGYSKCSIHHAVVFKLEILKFELYDDCQSQYIIPLIQQQISFLFRINATQFIKESIIHELKTATQAYHQQDIGWSITVKAALLKIIALLIREGFVIQSTELPTNDSDKVVIARKVMAYIHENYSKKITIKELAHISNMSPQYFCAFFKSMFGQTAIEYINKYRIEKACQLLKQTDDKVMNIAIAVGFENFSYFIRKFKSLKQSTPSAYRLAN